MTGRIVGAFVALFGVGLLALVLNGGGPGPSSVYSRGEGFLLIVGTALCLGGGFHAVKGQTKSAPDAPSPSQTLASRPAARRLTGAARGGSSETVTVAGAVLVSLTLGGLIGLWITTWRPSSASAVAPPPPEVKEAPGESATPSPAPAEEAPPPAQPQESPAAREEVAAAEPRDGAESARHDDRSAPSPVEVREDNPSSRKSQERASTTGHAATAAPVRARGRSLPCTLAAAPSSLTIKAGGAAAVNLRLDETAGSARVGASTPHWADIAVFAEQPAGGGRARYTVRSVSKRPGVYSVTFRTSCGAKTVHVTVAAS